MKRLSKRRTSNKKHIALSQIELTSGDKPEHRERLSKAFLQMCDMDFQFLNLEKNYKVFLNSKNLPSDIESYYEIKELGNTKKCQLSEYISHYHLDISGAYEAAQGLVYLFKTKDEYQKLLSELEQNIYIDIDVKITIIMGRLFNLGRINAQLQQFIMMDSYIAGGNKITDAHKQRTINKKNNFDTAKNWMAEFIEKGHSKERCYSLIANKFSSQQSSISVKAGTVKSWFKNTK